MGEKKWVKPSVFGTALILNTLHFERFRWPAQQVRRGQRSDRGDCFRVGGSSPPRNGMFGVEFTHHGEDFTFESLLTRFGLKDNVLKNGR